MRNTTKKTAFTLVELLTVIAIMALLLAILVPVFINSRNKAIASSCLSRMRQIAVAEKMYLTDYDGYYCPDAQLPTVVKSWRSAQGCPAAGTTEKTSPTLPGYGFNGQLHGFILAGVAPLSEQSLYAPTVTVSLGEITSGQPVTGWIDKKERARRHTEGANFLFCDGHSKWLRPDAVGSIEDENDGTKPTFNPLRHVLE